MRKRYVVVLPEAERALLHTLIGQGTASARALTHARILLKASQGEAGPGWTDQAIAAAQEVYPTTVARVRALYVTAGLGAAVYRKTPEREYRRTLDGEQEARLVALACSAPPEGRTRWTLRLLAGRLVELEVVDAVSYETVRQALRQTGGSRGGARAGASHPRPRPSSSGAWRTCWRSTPGRMTRAARRCAWTRPAASCWARSTRRARSRPAGQPVRTTSTSATAPATCSWSVSRCGDGGTSRSAIGAPGSTGRTASRSWSRSTTPTPRRSCWSKTTSTPIRRPRSTRRSGPPRPNGWPASSNCTPLPSTAAG